MEIVMVYLVVSKDSPLETWLKGKKCSFKQNNIMRPVYKLARYYNKINQPVYKLGRYYNKITQPVYKLLRYYNKIS